MKYAIAASMLALGLAACGGGGGGKSALMEKCVADGESKETCTCQIDAMEEALGSDNLNKLAKLAAADDEAGAEKLMIEIMMDKPESAMKMGMAMMACGS